MSAQSGGALSPIAAPGVTMKSLDQVEPRTPLVDGARGVSVDPVIGTVTISQPGSYYLTDNISVISGNAIETNAEGVTLDLNGFSISSSAATANGIGIYINGSQTRIFNGYVISGTVYNSGVTGDQFTGSGFVDGIATTRSLKSVYVQQLSVYGCDRYGIDLDSVDGSIVDDCVVQVTGSNGITSDVVRNSSVLNAGGIGIAGSNIESCNAVSVARDGIYGETVSHCSARTSSSLSSSEGINAEYSISHSVGYSQNGDGLKSKMVFFSYGTSGSSSSFSAGIDASYSVASCHGQSSGGAGIEAYTVMNSYGRSTGGAVAVSTQCHGIHANHSIHNSYGISSSNDGLHANIVSYSNGVTYGSDSSDDGIDAAIAVGSTSSGGENITNKYLMP